MLDLLIIVLLLIILDVLWFSWSGPTIYRSIISAKSVKLAGAFVAWMLIGIGIKYFVLSSENKKNKKNIALYGALFGFVVYGVYNATNYTLFEKYPINVALIDTLWGTFAVSLASFIVSKYI
jgi:uncharacterized membrane protein